MLPAVDLLELLVSVLEQEFECSSRSAQRTRGEASAHGCRETIT